MVDGKKHAGACSAVSNEFVFFSSSTSGTKKGNRSSTMRTGAQLTLFLAIIIGRLLQRDSWWCISNAVATEIISKNPANRKRSELVVDDASPNERLKRRLVSQKNSKQQASLSSRRRAASTKGERTGPCVVEFIYHFYSGANNRYLFCFL